MSELPQPPEPWAREIAVAKRLAREAGAKILAHYRSRDYDVEYKDKHESDPVTQADLDANQLIVAGLREAFPNDAILAEESADDPTRLRNPRLWCVDPLDGTREFVDRNGQFVVMIGLAEQGRARAGVVYQPTEDLLWWGVVGDQAHEATAAEERNNGNVVRVLVSTQSHPGQATMMVSRSHRSRTIDGVLRRAGITRELPLGSVGLKISRLVTGVADAYVSVTDRTQEWDACAPEAVVRGAGGMMTDGLGQPLMYNKEVPNTPRGMVASNGFLHQALIAAVAPVAQERGWIAPH